MRERREEKEEIGNFNMLSDHDAGMKSVTPQDGSSLTLGEIYEQPTLWRTTPPLVEDASLRLDLASIFRSRRVLLTGAGTSAHAAAAVAAAWPQAIAVPTTDLLVDPERLSFGVDAVISLARSGNSPESAAVVESIRSLHPKIYQLAITCNEDGALTQSGLDSLIALDPRTNDRSLVMTSSFSNLVLAGLCLAKPGLAAASVEDASRRAEAMLPAIDEQCRRLTSRVGDRIVMLSSSPSVGWAQEAALKALEMTAGRFPVLAESYLGLRHGPMSFIRPDTLVLCLLSSDPVRRLYEKDLIDELRTKKLGHVVAIGDSERDGGLAEEVLPAIAPQLHDTLRTPYEIVFPQLLGYHLSLRIGLNPDNPSPGGIINRVVQGVRVHSS
jgi:tagatose-6-phosphate ketose/aldose isomerase